MADIFPESREEEILVSTINGEEYDKAPESRIEALLLELKEVIEEGGGGGGTTNYNLLQNKPSINSVTLTGNKSLEDLSIPTAADLAGKQDVLPVTASGNDVAFNGELIDGQGNTLSVLAEALTKTASGNPVVITDCAGGKARSLITEINAIQDLHGYDKPWVGGAGKNMISMTVDSIKSQNTTGTWNGNEYSLYGLTFKLVTDSANNIIGIDVDGLATNRANLLIGIVPFSVGTYKISGSTGGSFSTWVIWCNNHGIAESEMSMDGEGIFYQDKNASLNITLSVFDGATVNHKMFYPMVRVSTASASFAPYSNICPISGRTAAVVTRSDGDEISEDFTIQLGTTVYGADINWDTGVMTVDHAIVDMGSLTYSKLADYIFAASISDKAIGRTNFMSSQYAVVDSAWGSLANGQITGAQSSGYIHVKDERYNDENNFKTAVTGQTVCYELVTPTTIQLTPTQLEMLKGYNRVTIESGTITLDYIAKAISGNDEEIAPLVGDKATKAYSVNDFIERADGLYRVTAPIASGASFTANNTVKMSIGEALTYLYNK